LVTFMPLALPWSLSGKFEGRGWDNISATWLIVQLTLTICGLALNLSCRRHKPKRSQ
jgi:hypothetical protein